MTKEQIDNFKELYKIFETMAEKIATKFADTFKIDFDFIKIRLRENYVTINYCQHNDAYYSGEDEIDYLPIEYEDLLLGYDNIVKKVIDERQQDIDSEKQKEKEKKEKEQQRELENELELYNKLKNKFEPIYDD
jgi:abortive infection bacteriophage resistance protein